MKWTATVCMLVKNITNYKFAAQFGTNYCCHILSYSCLHFMPLEWKRKPH
jgi:hypothetical protein